MAGPVDKIYVEIAAPIQRLDRDMRANEQRVDVGASRMAASVRKAEKTVTSAGAGVGGRAFAGSSRFALGALGLGISGAYIGRNIEGITVKFNEAVRGTLGALNDLGNGITDFGTLVSRNAPKVSGFWGRLADSAFAALNGLQTPDEQDAELERFRGLGQMADDAERELRRAKESTDEGKKRVDVEQRIVDLMRERDALIRQMPENAAAIFDAYNKRMDAAKLEGMPKPAAAAEAKARFDQIGTVFGGMRIATRDKAKPPASEESQKKQVDEQKKTNGLLTKIERAIGRNGVWA